MEKSETGNARDKLEKYLEEVLTTPNIKTAQNIVTQLKDYFVNELEHLNIDKNQKLYELKQEFKKKCEKIKKYMKSLRATFAYSRPS